MRGTLSSPAHLLFTNGFNGTSRHSLSNYDLLWLHPLILAGQRRTCNGLQCTKQLQYFLFSSHFTHGTPPSSCAKWCSEQITVPQSSGDPWTNAVPMTSLGRSSWLKPLSHRVSQTFPNLLSDHKSSAIVTSLFHSVLRWCSLSSAWDYWNRSFLWRHLQQWRATCYHKRLKVHDWCLCCNCDVFISNGSNGSPEAYCRGSDLARSGVHLSAKEVGRWEQRWKLRKYGKNEKGENERRVREDGREQVKTKKKSERGNKREGKERGMTMCKSFGWRRLHFTIKWMAHGVLHQSDHNGRLLRMNFFDWTVLPSSFSNPWCNSVASMISLHTHT